MIANQTDGVDAGAAVGNQGTPDDKGGNNKPAWMGQLPADLKADEELGKFSTIGDLAKHFKELNGKLSGSVKLPTKESKPEEVAAFHAALGRPESAEKYEFEKPKLPDGVSLDKNREAAFRQKSFELGLSQSQANALFNQEIEHSLNTRQTLIDNFKKKSEEAEAKLKAEWGNEYETKLTKAKTVFDRIAEKEKGMEAELKQFYSTPTGKRVFAMLSERVLDDAEIKGKNGGGDVRDKDPNTGRPKLKFKES